MNDRIERLVIIGGSDAGISAALRAKELDPAVDACVVVADRYPNFSICGLPFLASGEVAVPADLAHRTADDIEALGIRLLLQHRAVEVDPARRTCRVEPRAGSAVELDYDALVIGTGAVPSRPPIEGLDLPGVTSFRWMDEGIRVRERLDTGGVRAAVIVGGGYVGMEMADALTRRGLEVTLVEAADQVMTSLDADFATEVQAVLEERGVRIALGAGLERIARCGDRLVVTAAGRKMTADLVVVSVGGRPEVALARAAGARLGEGGAIRVDRSMATGVPGVWAAGDCVQTYHRLLDRHTYLPLGSTAHKQGRVAGENAMGGRARFAGTLGTQVVKVFDRVVGRTGLRQAEAQAAGFEPLTCEIRMPDHKAYYPGASELRVSLTGDRSTGKLLGGQLLGHHGAEIAKRIDVVAAGLYAGLGIRDLIDVDLSYTPPLSSPWDPIQVCAQEWQRQA